MHKVITFTLTPHARDVLCRYGHMLNINPALKFVEFYLLAAAVIHAVVATYLTFKYGKWKSMATNKLVRRTNEPPAFV